jgi:hypothetical protein
MPRAFDSAVGQKLSLGHRKVLMSADITHGRDLTILSNEADGIASRAHTLEQLPFDQVAQRSHDLEFACTSIGR